MREGIAIAAFTRRGSALGARLAAQLGASLSCSEQGAFSLHAWTAENFAAREALIFVGAAGIAVRAVVPCVKSKAEDPAVLCVDEYGRHVIPLLSGHLGGGNELARRVAALTGGEAVITTATDLNGLFAVDLWARRQGMAVLQPERIKAVSAKLLGGERVRIDCPWPVAGEMPASVELGAEGDVCVSCRRGAGGALQLVPRIVYLGIGCRRGAERETLEGVFGRFCAERGLLPESVAAAASIDRKADEKGLRAFCAAHGWPLRFFTADALSRTPGHFSASAFVERTVGVDNVCERAAVCACGGRLVEAKYAAEGVTFAAAEGAFAPDWSM